MGSNFPLHTTLLCFLLFHYSIEKFFMLYIVSMDIFFSTISYNVSYFVISCCLFYKQFSFLVLLSFNIFLIAKIVRVC